MAAALLARAVSAIEALLRGGSPRIGFAQVTARRAACEFTVATSRHRLESHGMDTARVSLGIKEAGAANVSNAVRLTD